MSTVVSALVTASAAVVGVLVGAGLQFLQARRTHAWQQQAAERAELRAAGVAYLTATWQLTQHFSDARRRQQAAIVAVDVEQVGTMVQVMTEARTQLDLVGGEAVYEATKRYHWELLNFVIAAEEGTLAADVNVDRSVVELRRTLMNQIRRDLGRAPVLRRWLPGSHANDDHNGRRQPE